MAYNLRHVLLINARCFHTTSLSLTEKLSKVELKHLKKRINLSKSTLKPEHFYRQIFKITNKYDLAEILIESEIHHEKGKFIGFVKPYGIRRYKENDDKKLSVTSTLNLSGFVSLTSLEEALPLLREHYKAPNLDVIYAPERFTSGVLILGYNSKANDFVKKCFRRSVGLKKSCQAYLAVVHGLPVPEATQERVCTVPHYVQNIGGFVPIIKKKYSRNDSKSYKVKPNYVEHEVLSYDKENDASLVEVNVVNDCNHFVRVWLAYCCSPVFGDRIFGGRVKTVLGKRMPINVNNYSSYQPIVMPPKLLEKLQLSPGQVEIIPPHIHLSKLTLRQVGEKEDIVITADPPEYFSWTCRQLSLMNEDGAIEAPGPVVINDIHDVEALEEDIY